MVFCLVLSVGQIKNSKSPWGIKPQTYGFHAPILYHWATDVNHMSITSNLLSSINHAKNTPEKALLCYSVLLRQFSWDRLEKGMYWNSHAAKLCYLISSDLFISQDLTSNYHLMLLYNSISVSQEYLDISHVTTCSQLLCWMHFKVKYLSCFRQM